MARVDKSTYQLLGSACGFLLLFLLFWAAGAGYLTTPDWLKTLDAAAWEEEHLRSSSKHGSESPSAPFVQTIEKQEPDSATRVAADSLPSVAFQNDSLSNKKNGLQAAADTAASLLRQLPQAESFNGDATIKERILLIGDSQCGGLRYPLYSYCSLNGHQLVASVTWYSSTTKHWAITDTLQHFMAKFQPTMVIVGLGLNEVFARDVEKRKIYIETINHKIDSAGAKVFWMGPAAWEKDKGIVSAIRNVNGARFFDATTLSLTRGGDGRHPDMKSYKFWFAHAAAYMTKNGYVDFSISEPYKNPGRDTKAISLSTHRL